MTKLKQSRINKPTTKTKNKNKKRLYSIDKLISVLVIIGAVFVSAFGSDEFHIAMVSTVFLIICVNLFDIFRHLSHKTRWIWFTFLVIGAFVACVIWELNWQSKIPQPVERPDISLRIVGPKSIAIVVINESDVLIRDARYSLSVWNLDSDRAASLPILDRTADWMRPDDYILPEEFASSPQIAPLIKYGDRLLGIADVSCPDCIRTKSYWVYAIHGQGGWFAESPVGKYPNPSMVARLIPQIRENPKNFLRDIPQSARVPITYYP